MFLKRFSFSSYWGFALVWESSGILVVVLKAKSESNFFTERNQERVIIIFYLITNKEPIAFQIICKCYQFILLFLLTSLVLYLKITEAIGSKQWKKFFLNQSLSLSLSHSHIHIQHWVKLNCIHIYCFQRNPLKIGNSFKCDKLAYSHNWYFPAS